MLVRMRGNGSTHSWLMGMEDGTAILENSLTVSLKTQCAIAIGCSTHIHRQLSQRNEDLC